MIHVERATAEMFEQVYPLLQRFSVNSPQITKEHWRRLFEYPWEVDDDTRGFILKDDNEIVGFEGTILYDRMIEGRKQRFCNITSWVVLPEYRKYGLRLTQPILDLPDTVLTTLTPMREHKGLNELYGFRDLDQMQRVIYPNPQWQVSSWLEYSTTTEPGRLLGLLNSEDARIFSDHRYIPNCHHLVVCNRRREYCYLVFTLGDGGRFRSAAVHYISNKELFCKALDLIKWRLFLSYRSLVITVDERMLAGRFIPHSKSIPLSTPRQFLSERVKPEQIDHLYTEMILLNI